MRDKQERSEREDVREITLTHFPVLRKYLHCSSKYENTKKHEVLVLAQSLLKH